jgi:flagellar hook-length control protein FliK
MKIDAKIAAQEIIGRSSTSSSKSQPGFFKRFLMRLCGTKETEPGTVSKSPGSPTDSTITSQTFAETNCSSISQQPKDETECSISPNLSCQHTHTQHAVNHNPKYESQEDDQNNSDQSSNSAPECLIASIIITPATKKTREDKTDSHSTELQSGQKKNASINFEKSPHPTGKPADTVEGQRNQNAPQTNTLPSDDSCYSENTKKDSLKNIADDQAHHPPAGACATSNHTNTSLPRYNLVDKSSIPNQQALPAGFFQAHASNSGLASNQNNTSKANDAQQTPGQVVIHQDQSNPKFQQTHPLALPFDEGRVSVSTNTGENETRSLERPGSSHSTSIEAFGKSAEATSVKQIIPTSPLAAIASQIDPGVKAASLPIPASSPNGPPPAIVDQAWQKVTAALEQGQKSVILQVDPPELGSVRIQLSFQDGQLQIKMECSQPESYRQLTNEVRELQNALNQNGLSHTTIDLSYQGTPGRTPFDWDPIVPNTINKIESDKPTATRALSATSALDLMA